MRKITGLSLLLIGLILVYILEHSWKIGDNPLPPLGKLLNPYTGVWQNSEDKLAYNDIVLKSKFVKNEIKIVFDERMVPHIYAQNIEDALFAQGYVEAYHRLFQMDVSTRSPDGRLAEVFGESLLAYDKKQRRLGLGFAADNAVEGWKKFPESYKLVEQYSRGVNHFINQLKPKDYPMEYKLLDFKPTKWTPRHCALHLKAMTQTLAGYEEDIEMSNALKLFGETDFTTIYPEHNVKDVPVIPGPYAYANPRLALANNNVASKIIAGIERPRSNPGVGSNNWAVAGSKTASGTPILANDPHLGLTLPSAWYEIAITTPAFSARGVSLPGQPGIMIGFNEHIAWGETNVGHDVMDYHQINWLDSNQTIYGLDGKKIKVTYRVETIKVKNKPDVIDSVRYTFWGPVVDDDKDLALRWLAHDAAPGPEIQTFVKGMQCRNYDEYLDATGGFYCPFQNFLYADNHGEIALRVNGSIPIKRVGQGRLISAGKLSSDDWQGFIPRSQNPQIRNPKTGFVTSANQWSASPEYPYYYNGSFEPYRGRMTNRLLSKMDSISAQDMIAMQQNVYSIQAEEALPILLKYLDNSYHKHPFTELLKEWDYNYTADSKAATIFDSWFTEFHELLWDEVYGVRDVTALPEPDVWVTIALLESNPTNKFFDIATTTKHETVLDIVAQSFVKTLKKLGRDVPKWVDSKQARIPHLTRLPAFSQENIQIGGYKHSINAMQQSFGPSWRMVVELTEKPTAYGIYPGGQSGNPASAYYKNNIEKWASGKYDKLTIETKAQEIPNPKFSITIKQ